jgi:hypothetical protein
MKKITLSAVALVTGLATALPAVAQDQLVRQGDETAMEMAQRVDACDGAAISDAEFFDNGTTRLRVQCAAVAGMTGGLGDSAPWIAFAVLGAAIAAGSTGSTSGT